MVICSNQTVIGVYFCLISQQKIQAKSYKWAKLKENICLDRAEEIAAVTLTV